MPFLNNKSMAQELGISVNRLGYYRRNRTLIREADGTWDRDKTIRGYNANVDVQFRSVKGYGAGRPKKNRGVAANKPASASPPLPPARVAKKVITSDTPFDDDSLPVDPNDPQGSTLIAARIRKTQAEAQQKELDFRTKCGELVRVDEVRRVWSRQISSVKSALLLLPAKVAPTLAVETDTVRVQMVLDAAVRQILQELSESETGKPSKSPGGA